MNYLTRKEAHILNIIRCYIREQGFVGRYEDIASIAGCSHSNTCRLINQLERKGYVIRPGHNRGRVTLSEEKAS